MGIFKRGVKTSQESGGLSAVPSFWRWWVSEGRPLADQAIQGDGLGNFADEISAQVTRIHPDMEWETAAGRTAQHALIITSGGISDRRSLAERCFRAAPPADATWEYHPARQPDPEALRSRLDLGGSELDLSLTRVGLTLDAERQKADVSVFHPGFATIPEQARGQATFLLLDWLLGEDGVERWLGAIEAVTVCPADALPAEALPETVLALAARTGDDQWALLEGQRDGKSVLVSAMRPMKWIDNPCWTSTWRCSYRSQRRRNRATRKASHSNACASSKISSRHSWVTVRSSWHTRRWMGYELSISTQTTRTRASSASLSRW